MIRLIGFWSIALTTAAMVSGQEGNAPTKTVWELQSSGTDASLRGLSVVSDQIAWASGTQGTVIKTTDGGVHWIRVDVPNADRLDFRDLHAFDDKTCVVINAGSPGFIFRTVDGGATWSEVYRNEGESIFFDAISFWDPNRGIAFSDPQAGRLLCIETGDGGRSWAAFDESRRPEMHPGEAAFAASGTSMAVLGERTVWIATGGEHGPDQEASARVFSSEDGGETWNVASTPIASTESAGIFSIAFANTDHGVVVGGDYKQPNFSISNVAITDDSGRHWRAPLGSPPSGYRSAVAVLNINFEAHFVAVGPTGSDISSDWGNSWRSIDKTSFNALAFTPDGRAGWAVGGDGRVGKWVGGDLVR